MNTLPVYLVFLTYWTGSHAHPHTIPTAVCPSADQVTQCEASNNFVSSFKVGIDPKSWTAAEMTTFCDNKNKFASYMTCLISAEKTCLGTANEAYALDPDTFIEDYHQFACQEKANIPGTCVTDNKVNIETCYANAIATIATTDPNYKCIWLNELDKCYMSNMATCTQHVRNVIDILIHKTKPAICGSDVIGASLSFVLLSVGATILASMRNRFTL